MHNGIGVKFGKPTRRKGSKFPIIMVIIIIVLALLAGIYFVHGNFFNGKETTTDKTDSVTTTEETENPSESEM